MKYCVQDFTDAFLRTPLRPDKRPHLCAVFEGRSLVWHRFAQGEQEWPPIVEEVERPHHTTGAERVHTQ